MRFTWPKTRPPKRRNYRPIRVVECLESRLLLTGAGDLIADTQLATVNALGILSTGQSATAGRIDDAQDRDVFVFTAETSGMVEVRQTAASVSDGTLPLDGLLRVFNDGSETPFAADNGTFDTTIPRIVSFFALAGQRYFVQVSGFGGSVGNYRLGINTIQERDLGELTAEQPLEATGRIRSTFERDYFQFDATDTTRIVIELNASSQRLDTFLTLRDSSGAIVAFDDDGGPGRNSRFSATVEEGETYVVEIRGFGRSTGSYNLRVRIAEDAVGETAGTAQDMGLLTAVNPLQVAGSLETVGDRDLFRFQAGSDGEAIFELGAVGFGDLDTVVTLLDSSGAVIDTNDDNGQTLDSRLAHTLEAGEIYFVLVQGFESTLGDYQLTLRMRSDPVGDALDSAQDLGVLTTETPLQLVGAIETAGDRDVFRFQTSRNGEVVIDLNDFDFSELDTVVTLLDSSGAVIGANDDDGFTLDSRLVLELDAGETYFVRVEGFGISTGNFQLTLRMPDDPVGDSPATAQDLGVLSAVNPLEVDGAIETSGDRDVYRFHATTTATIVIEMNAADSELDTLVRLRDSFGDVVDFDDDGGVGLNSRLTFTIEAGETYLIEAGGFDDSIGDYNLSVRVLSDLVGDTPETAQDLGILTPDTPIEMVGTIEESRDRDLFRFQASRDGEVVIDLNALDFSLDTVVTLLDSSGAVLGTNDDDSFTLDSRLVRNLDAGETYFVLVEGFGLSRGDFQLTLRMPDDPVGDSPATAQDLGVLSAVNPLEVEGAIETAGDRDLYRFRATTTTRIVVEMTATDSELDTLVRLRDSSGSVVAIDDDGGTGFNSRLFFTVEAGESYSLETGGFDTSTGDYSMSVRVLAEVGETLPTAQDLGVLTPETPIQLTGSIETSRDRDLFRFQASRDGEVVIDLNALDFSLDTVVTLLDSSGAVLGTNDDDGFTLDSRLVRNLDAGETYFVLVEGFGLSRGDFQLTLRMPTDPVGDSPATAQDLGVLSAVNPLQVAGTIETAGDRDLYRFRATTTTVIAVEMTATDSELDTLVRLRDSSGSVVAIDDDGGVGFNSLLFFVVQAGETYSLEAGGFDTSAGDYSLTVQELPVDQVEAFTKSFSTDPSRDIGNSPPNVGESGSEKGGAGGQGTDPSSGKDRSGQNQQITIPFFLNAEGFNRPSDQSGLITLNNDGLEAEDSLTDIRDHGLPEGLFDFESLEETYAVDLIDDMGIDGTDLFTVFELDRVDDQFSSLEVASLTTEPGDFAERGSRPTTSESWLTELRQSPARWYQTIDQVFSSPLAPVSARKLWQAVQPNQSKSKLIPSKQTTEDGSSPKSRESTGTKTSATNVNGSKKKVARQGSSKTESPRSPQKAAEAQPTADARLATTNLPDSK